MTSPYPYADIIHLPHHISKKHRPMPLADRAAQFSPFAALTGYDDVINETARLVDQKTELSEDARLLLDRKLHTLSINIDEQPEINITYFVPDTKKDGGAYLSVYGMLKKIDPIHRELVLTDGTSISFEDILDIDCPLFDYLI